MLSVAAAADARSVPLARSSGLGSWDWNTDLETWVRDASCELRAGAWEVRSEK